MLFSKEHLSTSKRTRNNMLFCSEQSSCYEKTSSEHHHRLSVIGSHQIVIVLLVVAWTTTTWLIISCHLKIVRDITSLLTWRYHHGRGSGWRVFVSQDLAYGGLDVAEQKNPRTYKIQMHVKKIQMHLSITKGTFLDGQKKTWILPAFACQRVSRLL